MKMKHKLINKFYSENISILILKIQSSYYYFCYILYYLNLDYFLGYSSSSSYLIFDYFGKFL